MSKIAETLDGYIRKNDYFRINLNKKYGINVSSKDNSAKGDVHVDFIYIQEFYYYMFGYYGTEPPKETLSVYGQFTQVVWKGTKMIGVGKSGGIAVILYYPKGNVNNKFAKSVLPK